MKYVFCVFSVDVNMSEELIFITEFEDRAKFFVDYMTYNEKGFYKYRKIYITDSILNHIV